MRVREKKLFYIITFSKTTDAFAFEKKCGEESIGGRIIPLPSKISAGCGLAWRMGEDDYNDCFGRLQALGLKYEEIVLLMMRV